MKCTIGVLVSIASLCLAEPEADPLHYYAPYSYPYFYRPYYASGYAGPLPGASYQSVHRLHKREAEADPQFLAAAAPYVNDGPVAGPLTAAFGDLVATERGLRPISLEGFSEDLNEDGFVDPIAQAVPVAAPLVAAPAPLLLPPSQLQLHLPPPPSQLQLHWLLPPSLLQLHWPPSQLQLQLPQLPLQLQLFPLLWPTQLCRPPW